jgi:hypothetical protein
VTLVPGRTTSLPVPLTQGGRAAVTVVDAATGQPVRGVCFALREPHSGGIGDGYGDCTGATGKSTTIVRPAGTYQLFAVARDGGYGHQWVGTDGGTGDQREAARITLRPGKITKAPVVRMDKAGRITGTVTGDDGRPIGSADVSFTAWDYGAGPVWGTDTDADGRYTIDGLGPYSWPLVFTAHGYARQWSGGGGNRYQAAGVPVPAGGSTTYDMALARGSVLRGTVTVPPALPVQGWRLTAVNATTGDPIGVADYTALDNGDYTMPIAGGQPVKIRWSVHGDDFWQDGWYDNAADQASATKVPVPRTGTRTLDLTIGR